MKQKSARDDKRPTDTAGGICSPDTSQDPDGPRCTSPKPDDGTMPAGTEDHLESNDLSTIRKQIHDSDASPAAEPFQQTAHPANASRTGHRLHHGNRSKHTPADHPSCSQLPAGRAPPRLPQPHPSPDALVPPIAGSPHSMPVPPPLRIPSRRLEHIEHSISILANHPAGLRPKCTFDV